MEEESSSRTHGIHPYEEFSETLHQFTRYSGWRELSSLNYGDQSNAYSIVSSIEFNRDGEIFAVGGVTKKIKVSSYTSPGSSLLSLGKVWTVETLGGGDNSQHMGDEICCLSFIFQGDHTLNRKKMVRNHRTVELHIHSRAIQCKQASK